MQIKQDGKRPAWYAQHDMKTLELAWARFYEISSNRPIFLDRDSVVRYSLAEIGQERRGGYDYYGTRAAGLLAKDYPRWRVKHTLPKE